MRVATNSFSSQFLSQVRTLTERQNRLQTQAATGQRIQSAEDDPAAMQRVLDLQAEGSGIKQFQNNTRCIAAGSSSAD